MSCAAILLAAGASTRLGQPKQLVEYQGESLLKRAQRIAQEAGAFPIIVVTGANHDQVLKHCNANETLNAYNSEWESGMASSIRAGLEALDRSPAGSTTQAVLLLTCDQPAVTPEHLRALMHIARTGTLAASTYANRTGIPAAFPRSFFPQLLTLTGDEGARHLLQSADVARIPLLNGAFDIDTPADLERLNHPSQSK